MNKKKLTFLLILIFLTTSCGNSWDSVKRGLTGAKSKSADEFKNSLLQWPCRSSNWTFKEGKFENIGFCLSSWDFGQTC